jgi:hypothetical protein
MITRDSTSKERRIYFLFSKLRSGLEKMHTAKCKCEACSASRRLREEFGILDED